MRALGSLRMIPLLVDRLVAGTSPYLDSTPDPIDIPAGIEGTALLLVQFRPIDPSFGSSVLQLWTEDLEGGSSELLATIRAVELTGDDEGTFGPMLSAVEIPVDRINRRVRLLHDFADDEIYDVAVALLVDEGKTPTELGGTADYAVAGTPGAPGVAVGIESATLYSGSIAFDDVDVASEYKDLLSAAGPVLFMFSHDSPEGLAADATIAATIQESDDAGEGDPWAPIEGAAGPYGGADPFPGAGESVAFAKSSLKRYVRVLIQGGGTTGVRPFRVDVFHPSSLD